MRNLTALLAAGLAATVLLVAGPSSLEGGTKPIPLDAGDLADLAGAAALVSGDVGDAADAVAGDPVLGVSLAALEQDVFLLGEVPGQPEDEAWKLRGKIKGREARAIVIERSGGGVDVFLDGGDLPFEQMLSGGAKLVSHALGEAGEKDLARPLGKLLRDLEPGEGFLTGGPMGALMGGIGSILGGRAGKSLGRVIDSGLAPPPGGGSGTGRLAFSLAEQTGNPCYGSAAWDSPPRSATLHWYVGEGPEESCLALTLDRVDHPVRTGAAPAVRIMALRVGTPGSEAR